MTWGLFSLVILVIAKSAKPFDREGTVVKKLSAGGVNLDRIVRHVAYSGRVMITPTPPTTRVCAASPQIALSPNAPAGWISVHAAPLK